MEHGPWKTVEGPGQAWLEEEARWCPGVVSCSFNVQQEWAFSNGEFPLSLDRFPAVVHVL
jgi:hypothetical protein